MDRRRTRGRRSPIADPTSRSRASCVTRMLDGVPGSKVLPGIKRRSRDLGIEPRRLVLRGEPAPLGPRRRGAGASSREAATSRSATGALFFKSDERGRRQGPRRQARATARFTYFASDIAYHADKIARGYDRLIDVLGADHHGYMARVRDALEALGLPAESASRCCSTSSSASCATASRTRWASASATSSPSRRWSRRSTRPPQRKGAGADALRYFYLSRRSDTTIDLDIEIAKKTSLDNPVFYLQYGHARLVLDPAPRQGRLRRSDVPALRPELAARLDPPRRARASSAQLGRFPARGRARPPRCASRTGLSSSCRNSRRRSRATSRASRTRGDPILPHASERRASGWEAALGPGQDATRGSAGSRRSAPCTRRASACWASRRPSAWRDRRRTMQRKSKRTEKGRTVHHEDRVIA